MKITTNIVLKMSLMVLICIGSFMQASAQKTIKVTGKLQYQNPQVFAKYNYVWLSKGITGSEKAIDSVKVNNDGTYSLDLKISKPGFYRLDILKWQSVTFWADEDLSILSRGYDTAQVKARNSGFVNIVSKSSINKFINTQNYAHFQEQILLNDMISESFEAQKYRSTDSIWYNYLRSHNIYKKLVGQSENRVNFQYANTVDIPSKLYMLSIMNRVQNGPYIQGELDKLLALQPNLTDATLLKAEIFSYLETIRKTQSGSPIPDISYPTPDDKILNVKSLRGKYLIVDFWASWCGPCRKSIPKLKNLYELYHNKGFDILSISIDTDKDAWRKAMTEEAMPWNQVLSPDKNKTMSDFNIKGVPTLFIVDPNGRIVEKFTGYNPQIDEILKSKLGSK